MFDQELWLSQGQKSHILKCESGAPISNDDNLIETEGQTNLGWFQQKFCIQKMETALTTKQINYTEWVFECDVR